MKVDVYWNLHRKLYSVRDRSTGLVIAHVRRIRMEDVEFVVQPAGRERVRETGRKSVHAFVRGTWLRNGGGATALAFTAVTYNPYVNDTFVTRYDGLEVRHARRALLISGHGTDGKRRPLVFADLTHTHKEAAA
jgi:hypothetical protein